MSITWIFYLLLFILIGSFLWNTIVLLRVKRGNTTSEIVELKYRVQYLTFAFSTIIAIATFFGWDKVQGIDEQVTTHVNDKLKTLNKTIDSLQFQLQERTQKLDDLQRATQDIGFLLYVSSDEANNLVAKINQIKASLSGLDQVVSVDIFNPVKGQSIYNRPKLNGRKIALITLVYSGEKALSWTISDEDYKLNGSNLSLLNQTVEVDLNQKAVVLYY